MRYLPRTEDGKIRKVKDYRITAVFERSGKVIEIQRDKWGKFHVSVGGRRTQYNLTAEGIVNYMANMLHGG